MENHSSCCHISHGKEHEKRVKDPVCGMDVDPKNAKGGSTVYKGKEYFFCSSKCLEKFSNERRFSQDSVSQRS